MTIIKCDKCGKTANGKYYDANESESRHNEPYVIILQEGTCYEGEQLIEDRKTVCLELCRECFEILKEKIERMTS